MYWQYPPCVLLLCMAVVIPAALVLFVWRRRPGRGAMPAALLALAVAGWSSGYAIELAAADLSAKLFAAKAAYLGKAFVPTAWLIFVLRYTARERWLSRRNLVLLTIEPLVTLLLAWTNESHLLIYRDFRLDASGPFPMLDLTFGVWSWVDVMYSYLLLLLGALVLIQTLVRSPHLYRGQIGTLLLGALPPMVAGVLSFSGLSPFPHLDLTPFAFTLTCLATVGGFFGFRLLDIVPVAREAVLESMSDGVIALDTKNHIADLNSAAQQIIGSSASGAIGRPVAEVLSGRSDLVGRYRDVLEAREEIVLGPGEAPRYFDLRISPLHDRRGRFTGRLVVLRDITERKLAEKALRESEEMYKALVMASPDAVTATDLEGYITDVSQRTLELHGFEKAEELLGKSVLALIAPEDHKAAMMNMQRTLREGVVRDVEYTFLKKGGSRFIGELSAALIKGLDGEPKAFVATTRDITERRQAEEDQQRLLTAEQEQRLLTETLREVTLALASRISHKAVLDEVLRQAQRLVPYRTAHIMLLEEDTLRIAHWQGYQASESEEHISSLVQRLADLPLDAKVIQSRKPLVIADTHQDPRWVVFDETSWVRSHIAVPICLRDRVLGLLRLDGDTPGEFSSEDAKRLEPLANAAAIAIQNAQFYEQIQRHAAELEQRVAERTRELEEANAQLQELDRLKSKFVSDVSHELRTPVANIGLYLHLLQRGKPDKQAQYQGVIKEQTERLATLIDDILNLSRLDLAKEQGKVTFAPIDLNMVAEQVVAAQRPRAEAAGLELILESDTSLPPVRAESNQLAQVITNLVTNALSYTLVGQVRVSTSLDAERGQVCVEVRDTGMGIDPEDLPHLFERFYRGRRVGSSSIPGTGLGLAIVKEIVDLHGGRIDVESQMDQGSTFRVWLPQAERQA